MAERKNAQRVSYKATYNQISPVSTVANSDGAGRTKLPSRALDKAAFVQSLGIVPAELPILKKRAAASDSDITRTELRAAMNAVERIVNDRTSSSTLANSSAFAEISPVALAIIARELAAHRQTVADEVNDSVGKIVTAYRDSLSSAAMPEQPKPSRAQVRTRGTSRTNTTTDLGIAVITTAGPTSTSRSTARVGVENRSANVTIAMDDSKQPPSALVATLAADSRVDFAPSEAAAMDWANKHEPRLFGTLVQQLQPYLPVSVEQRKAIGDSRVVLDYLRGKFGQVFDTGVLQGAAAGFESRMTIEPIGNLHLERIEMYPVGVQQAELVHSLPLAPLETVNISHKEWSVTEREFEDIVEDYFEGYSEEGVAEKTDIAMSTDSQTEHATALNLGASLSASYSSITLSTSFGYNATSNDSRSKKDSRNHSMELTKKASARTKKDHKMTFKVTSVAGSEDQSVRVISNPSETESMRVDYFQLARKWKVDLLRYGLRMTYDIVIPNPGAGIIKLVEDVKTLDAKIGTPFTFRLPLTAITYNALAADPTQISNYDRLAAQYNASVTPPPEARIWVNVHKETPQLDDDAYDWVHFDSVEFDIDDDYYINQVEMEYTGQTKKNEPHWVLSMIGGESLNAGAAKLIGQSGHLSLDFMFQNMYNVALNITFVCRPKAQVLQAWRLEVWNQIRQAAEEQYNKSLQTYQEQRAALLQQIADFDALTLRRMEQEEVMKGVLRWLLGPQFDLVPFDLASLFGPDASDPDAHGVLDPNRLTDAEWLRVMEHGEFIKYIHNAIEWENVLYFTYPYFWDNTALWNFKKFLYHPDSTHRTFLRSGAARVVLTIRPGFEASFTSLVESGAFDGLPGPHPYVTIAKEIQNFAATNYPGFPPANPEQNARPLVYLEQQRVWREMQFIIQLLNACKEATGEYPSGSGTQTVPATALTPFLDGPVVLNGASYNGINDYNAKANAEQLALDPTTPEEALLPTYTAVPISDLVWDNDYFYKCPGDTGDYDLISYGANGQPGGTGKDADISANCEASLTSTWYEYTPVNAMDIGITMNPPNAVPAQPSPEIA
jgi:hypothetical protein